MRLVRLFLVLLPGLLAACSTPYRAPVVVRGSAAFPGIATVVAAGAGRPVDVLLVHGMCTRDAAWAEDRIDRIAGAVAAHAPDIPAARPDAGGIRVIEQTRQLAGGTVRFHALLWSPLTAPLKRQLDYDRTGTPTDCAADATCRPARALVNGMVKDRLLDDCLSDVIIYEGMAGAAIRARMVEAVMRVLDSQPEADVPLVVVAESLGSKMLFDALNAMLDSPRPALRDAGRRAARRLGLLFMAGNQLPLLGLGAQPLDDARAASSPAGDALQRFLDLRRRADERAGAIGRLTVVALSDPNDLLSYQLLPARYAERNVAVADVLVSNAPAWFGLIENPVTAHLGYLEHDGVGTLIACGFPTMTGCRR